jgi:hypothetical protein
MLKGKSTRPFGTLVELRAGALVVSVNPFFSLGRVLPAAK